MFMLNTFEGMRLEYQRGLSPSFGVGHNVCLQPSADQFGTYDFAANFQQGKVRAQDGALFFVPKSDFP